MSYSPGSDKESDVTEHTHTYTMHALVKGVVRNSISYIKTKLEGRCFRSYFLFFFFFSQLPASLHVFPGSFPPPPHLTLPPISLSSGLYFLKKTFIYLSQCVQDRSGSIIIMKYKITQACFSFLGLLQASRKFSRDRRGSGERESNPSPLLPTGCESKAFLLTNTLRCSIQTR